MASHGGHNAPRSMSPDPFADHRYDPHDVPSDPIPLKNLTPYHSPDLRRGDSPGISPPQSPPIGLSFSRPTGVNSYTPLHGSEGQRQSGAASLFSNMSSLSYYKTKDHETQQILDRRAGEIAEWHIHWITPTFMLVLFIAGIGAALGHHFFYSSLNGKPAENQLRMVRYGTALAFFVKSALVGSVILCYRQRIWHTFRTRALTITGIDGLFSATEDPTQFFYNGEMIRNGKIATIMALCSWLIPIASVLSPASLTSDVTELRHVTVCPSVATLNFTNEAMFNFRNEKAYAGSSLVFYNTTDNDGNPGYFDYYDQPSQNAKRLVYATMYLRKPATFQNASRNSCGEHFNCTYEISFEAPGYKCDELADSSNPDVGNSPIHLSDLAPEGPYIYHAIVDEGEYKMPQTETGEHGIPKNKPWPESLGFFEAEPVLWIGHTYKDDSPHKKREAVYESKIFKCVAHHTNYTFQMQYTDTNQNYTCKHKDFLRPLVDTTLTPDPTNSTQFRATPESNFITPKGDVPTYKRTASYHALGQLFRGFLAGSLSKKKNLFFTHSDISITKLIDANTTYPLPNLADEIQNLFEDMLIGLLSDPHLIVSQKQEVPCTKTRVVNVFVYQKRGLWIGYAFAVVSAAGCLFVGGWAIHQNGVASDTLFSRILVTTRNPTLDRLSVGACLGGDPFPKELTKTKLRFGVLLEEDPREGPLGKVEHCCFGAVGETKQIVKHGVYAGLKEWRSATGEVGELAEKEPLLSNGKESF